MKNKLNFLLVLALVFISIGCGLITSRFEKASTDNNSGPADDSNSNKSVVDQTIEDIADGETTGDSGM